MASEGNTNAPDDQVRGRVRVRVVEAVVAGRRRHALIEHAGQQPVARQPGRGVGLRVTPRHHGVQAVPGWSKAVKSAALEAAGSSTRGGGWAPSGLASSWER